MMKRGTIKALVATLLLLGATMAGKAEARDRRVVEAWTHGGYATASCPRGFSVERCDFDYGNCDYTLRLRDSCRADSRDRRSCWIRAYCLEDEPRRVQIQGSTDYGYQEIQCPVGYRVESCRFDYSRCDNTRERYYSCGAYSRNRQHCQFSGICVSQNVPTPAEAP